MKASISISLLLFTLSSLFANEDIPLFHDNEIVVRLSKEWYNKLNEPSSLSSLNHTPLDALNTFYNCESSHVLIPVTSFPTQKKGRDELERVYVLRFQDPIVVQDALREYQSIGLFDYVEPSYIGTIDGQSTLTPNDQFYYNRQYYHFNDGTFFSVPNKIDADIDMAEAWEISQGDTSVVVGIVDTGLKLDHPEFSGRIWVNKDEQPGNGIDDDGNGYIDDINGWNFAYANNNPTDNDGHGTNVTGIMAATGNNGIGYAGVDWKCKLMVLKGINDFGSGSMIWWANAITYAVDNGARVINMSLGRPVTSQTLKNAVDYAYNNDVIIVCTTGNFNSFYVQIPASYENVIAVGATGANDQRVKLFSFGTGGSSYGNHIDIVAPGDYMYGLKHNSNTSYSLIYSGTSQAAPLVSGVASLLIAQDPSRTVDDVKNILYQSADDQVGNPAEDIAGWDIYHGHGRLNAYQALTYQPPAALPEPTKETVEIKVFPVPAQDILSVELITTSNNNDFKISLHSIIGNDIDMKWSKVGENTFTTDISLLSSGIYYISANNGHIKTEKRVLVTK